MSRDVCTCGPDEMLTAAARRMWECDIGCVPIVDAERRVVGMLTDRDIAMSAYTQGRALDAIPIDQAMAHKVLSCNPEDAITRAEEIMRTNKVRRLPVIDGDNRLVGILSLNDVARAPGHKKGNDVAATLAAICEPRHHPTTASAA
jgi:CBS domain-containing protein